MTYEKHTTHTDALDTLGTITGANEKRDAIHLAVEPATAAVELVAGEHVAIDIDGNATLAPMGSDRAVGIVDPFLQAPVPKGAQFWLVVYPRQITSLRHVWEHPAFPPSADLAPQPVSQSKAAAEAWLRAWCANNDTPGFDPVMSVIETGSWSDNDENWPSRGEYADWGNYIHFRGVDAHASIPAEFWDHVEVYLGRPIVGNERVEGFSCSC